MTFPTQHRTKLHSTNPIERLNGEIKRRTEVVGIFPNEDANVRLVGAILLEQNDEWAVRRATNMTLENHRAFERSSNRQPSGYRLLPTNGVTRTQLHQAGGHDPRARPDLFSFTILQSVCDFRMAQKRCDFDEAEKFLVTVFVADNLAKPRNIAGLAARCLPAIAFVARGDLYLSRKSRRESVAAERISA